MRGVDRVSQFGQTRGQLATGDEPPVHAIDVTENGDVQARTLLGYTSLNYS